MCSGGASGVGSGLLVGEESGAGELLTCYVWLNYYLH